jgi:hypothetical protein
MGVPALTLPARNEEGWNTVLTKKIKKTCKNKEQHQKKQTKLLQRQAKNGPAWANAGGILPSSLGSTNGSPRHSTSSSDLNQGDQSQEIRQSYSNSSGSPDNQGSRPDIKVHSESQSNLSSCDQPQIEDDDATETENSQGDDHAENSQGEEHSDF